MEQTPSSPQPTDQQPPPQNPQPKPATLTDAASTTPSSLPPPAATSSFPNPNPNFTAASNPPAATQSQQSTPTSQARPTFGTRPWQQQPSYSHFSLPSPPNPASSSSTPPSVSAPSPPRGGIAIGVPAQIPSASPSPPASFSSLTPPSYGQQSQIRQPMQGMGITGTLGTASAMRPLHQLRAPAQPQRPQASSSSPSLAGQNFQGHGIHSSQTQSQTQPWLSSGTQGKPPLPPPTFRPQAGPQSFQPRSITQQLQNNMSTSSQQQIIGSNQHSPQPSASGQPQDHFTPQIPTSRTQQSLPHQQQVSRGPGSGIQRPPIGLTQPGKTMSVDTDESSKRLLSKRSIQEIVNQIDPSEKLDPEVEDILIDFAEDFVESITTFGCSLAKHRKSTTLEAKDIMLHLERNWNITLPGFGGDEIKLYKKPTVTEIHRERLAAIKKSILTTEMASKTPAGPPGASSKGHLAKGPSGNIGAPSNPKIREAT
ncbi:transcription initiation factor TFIID subunit 12 [Striga asiatica]|uniref:Transcription initiation factor TFIID subunit 12 n=1 Tax=Striga asiatica TaxID=4170 RepID=A0A5A7P8L9_STRAF|nr:transcription initiation factor TFIID subunit 12 [Striga asiatica]